MTVTTLGSGYRPEALLWGSSELAVPYSRGSGSVGSAICGVVGSLGWEVKRKYINVKREDPHGSYLALSLMMSVLTKFGENRIPAGTA